MARHTPTFLGIGAALLAGGVAFAQPPRLIPPVDQSGIPVAGVSPLQIPGEPASSWLMQPGDPAYQLQLGGTLEQAGPDTIRVDRGMGEPDAILTLAPDTSFFLDGQAVSRSQIPLGSDVVAVFDLSGDVRVARQVQASSPGNPVAAAETLQPTAPPIAAQLPGARVTEGTPHALLPAGSATDVRPLPDAPEVPMDAD